MYTEMHKILNIERPLDVIAIKISMRVTLGRHYFEIFNTG